MTVAAELLARLEHHHITAEVGADGTIHLHADGPIPAKVEQLVAKYEPQLRGLITHRARLTAGGEPACWCNRCGATVTQYDPDGTAWCDLCLVTHAARLATTGFDSAEVVEEVTAPPNQATDPQLTLTQEKD